MASVMGSLGLTVVSGFDDVNEGELERIQRRQKCGMKRRLPHMPRRHRRQATHSPSPLKWRSPRRAVASPACNTPISSRAGCAATRAASDRRPAAGVNEHPHHVAVFAAHPQGTTGFPCSRHTRGQDEAGAGMADSCTSAGQNACKPIARASSQGRVNPASSRNSRLPERIFQARRSGQKALDA